MAKEITFEFFAYRSQRLLIFILIDMASVTHKNHHLPSVYTGFKPGCSDQLTRENKVVDWLQDQKYADPGEEAYVTRRDLGARRIQVDNAGSKPVMIKITTDPSSVLKWSELTFPTHFPGDRPIPRGVDYVHPNATTYQGTTFLIYANESRFLGLNPYDGPLQYMCAFDPHSGNPVGNPIEIAHNAQIFVLREGIQGWFFSPFQTAGYRS